MAVDGLGVPPGLIVVGVIVEGRTVDGDTLPTGLVLFGGTVLAPPAAVSMAATV